MASRQSAIVPQLGGRQTEVPGDGVTPPAVAGNAMERGYTMSDNDAKIAAARLFAERMGLPPEAVDRLVAQAGGPDNLRDADEINGTQVELQAALANDLVRGVGKACAAFMLGYKSIPGDLTAGKALTDMAKYTLSSQYLILMGNTDPDDKVGVDIKAARRQGFAMIAAGILGELLSQRSALTVFGANQDDYRAIARCFLDGGDINQVMGNILVSSFREAGDEKSAREVEAKMSEREAA